jgi:hypothetical protein
VAEELRHPEELRLWLEKQTREVIIAMGARAALRMIPLLVGAIGREPYESDAIIPKVFFANSVSWAVAQFPERQSELRKTAAVARDGVRLAAQAASLFVPGAAVAAANSAANAVRAAARTTNRVSTIAADVLRALDYTAAVAADAKMIDGGVTLRERTVNSIMLAGSPLWLVERPAALAENWTALKRGLKRFDQDWGVWIDWYEDRLYGRTANPLIEVQRTTLASGFSREPPRPVNAAIRRMIEGWRAPSEPPAEPIPPQGAGPHFTFGPAARIALAPPAEINGVGNNTARIRQLLPLARRAADNLTGHLNPNAFPELARDVADYRTALAAEENLIAWGTVFGLGVMLENAGTAARRKIEDRLQPPLEDAAQSALDSLLILHGPLILATAEGRELSDEADRMRLTREEQAKLRADARMMAEALQQDNEIIERPAAELVAKAAEAMNEGSHPERGSVFGLATMKNVTITLIGVAAVSAAFGMNVVEAGATLLTIEAVKKSETFSAVTSVLGQNIDRVLGVGIAYRRFVIANQGPLRQIAANTGQSGWMQPHIDRIVQAGAANQPDLPEVPPR